MGFTDAFSVANPFSVNPLMSNTPQAARERAMKEKENKSSQGNKPNEAEAKGGEESISNAYRSPLLESLSAPTIHKGSEVNAPTPAMSPESYNNIISRLAAIEEAIRARQSQAPQFIPQNMTYIPLGYQGYNPFNRMPQFNMPQRVVIPANNEGTMTQADINQYQRMNPNRLVYI